jgi:hypothetical protein
LTVKVVRSVSIVYTCDRCSVDLVGGSGFVPPRGWTVVDLVSLDGLDENENIEAGNGRRLTLCADCFLKLDAFLKLP